jgi:hypothetical protein
MLVCVFAGCNGGNNTSGDTSKGTLSINTAVLSNFKLVSPTAGEKYYTNTVDVTWEGLEKDETVSLKIEKKNGSSYTTVLEKAGLTGDSFKSDDKLDNEGVYKISAIVNLKDGNTVTKTVEVTVLNLVKNATVNQGLDFTFKGSISEKVLNNYLSRAITYENANTDEALRAILNTGAKYISRSAAEWYPSKWFEDDRLPIFEELIEKAHSIDPDIIFEGCIFETTGKDINDIKIPAFVFEAFGKEPEDRCFDHRKMLFPDGHGKNMWAAGYSLPDITREETQMFIYYRACKLIDIGVESIHLGQTKQTGKNDKNNKRWAKVIHLIREYGKKNARRNYIIINSHHPGHDFVGTDGVMLVDFNMAPLRPLPVGAANSSPQKCVLNMKDDAPYGKNISGTSPSGWTSSKYPYMVEFDNYDPTSADGVWGMDEISWIVNQPEAYRRSFLTEVRKMVAALNDNGHVALIGKRSTSYTTNGIELYMMNDAKYCKGGFDDEEAIIAAFKAYK